MIGPLDGNRCHPQLQILIFDLHQGGGVLELGAGSCCNDSPSVVPLDLNLSRCGSPSSVPTATALRASDAAITAQKSIFKTWTAHATNTRVCKSSGELVILQSVTFPVCDLELSAARGQYCGIPGRIAVAALVLQQERLCRQRRRWASHHRRRGGRARRASVRPGHRRAGGVALRGWCRVSVDDDSDGAF
eukprot:916719-Rhodomonas_salina.1